MVSTCSFFQMLDWKLMRLLDFKIKPKSIVNADSALQILLTKFYRLSPIEEFRVIQGQKNYEHFLQSKVLKSVTFIYCTTHLYFQWDS